MPPTGSHALTGGTDSIISTFDAGSKNCWGSWTNFHILWNNHAAQSLHKMWKSFSSPLLGNTWWVFYQTDDYQRMIGREYQIICTIIRYFHPCTKTDWAHRKEKKHLKPCRWHTQNPTHLDSEYRPPMCAWAGWLEGWLRLVLYWPNGNKEASCNHIHFPCSSWQNELSKRWGWFSITWAL